MVTVKKTKKNNKTDKIVKSDKQNKNLVYNQQHTFAKFKDISAFKKLSLDLCAENVIIFIKNFLFLKNLIHKQKKRKN